MSTPPKVQAPLLTDRIKSLEELSNGIAAYVQNELPRISGGLQSMVEVINAIIALGGEGFEEKVAAKIKEEREKRLQEEVAKQKAQLAQLVEAGTLVVSERVGENSLIVGRELNNEGVQIGSGRAQVNFSQFTDEAKALVLGQGVGFLIEVPTGKFEVQEIYDFAPPKEETVAGDPSSKPEVAPTEAPAAL